MFQKKSFWQIFPIPPFSFFLSLHGYESCLHLYFLQIARKWYFGIKGYVRVQSFFAFWQLDYQKFHTSLNSEWFLLLLTKYYLFKVSIALENYIASYFILFFQSLVKFRVFSSGHDGGGGADLPSVINGCDTEQNIWVTIFGERKQTMGVPHPLSSQPGWGGHLLNQRGGERSPWELAGCRKPSWGRGERAQDSCPRPRVSNFSKWC